MFSLLDDYWYVLKERIQQISILASFHDKTISGYLLALEHDWKCSFDFLWESRILFTVGNVDRDMEKVLECNADPRISRETSARVWEEHLLLFWTMCSKNTLKTSLIVLSAHLSLS